MAANADLVMKLMAAVRGGDLETARGLTTDDYVWHVPGTSTISGDAVGVDAVAEKLRRLVEAGLRPEMIAVLEGESHVAVVQRNVASADGRELDVRVVSLFTVDDGKLARMETFFGDQPAAEEFWNAVLP